MAPAFVLACRCEQQPLSVYFERAEFVAMAKLVSAKDAEDDRVLEFELMAAPHKGGDKTDLRGTTFRLVTTSSTASCGVPIDIDAIYVIFGYDDGSDSGSLRVDTCSGSRIHLSARLSEPAGFVDVPARFVAKQLNALAGGELLREASANAPSPDDPENTSLIGLLAIEPLAHGGHVDVFAAPGDTAPAGRISDWDGVESREVGYEVPAAVVFARTAGWYRVRRADGGFGWIAPGTAGTWFPYETLPVHRLAYLTDEWSGLVWPGTGAGIPWRIANPAHETPVEVLDSGSTAGFPWFRVTILESDPCAGGEPRKGYTGWVPAYGRSGKPTVWYYSRGC